MGQGSSVITHVVALLLALLVWWGITEAELVQEFLLPKPYNVGLTFWEIITKTDTWENMGHTALAVGLSALIAIPLGSLIGFASAANPYWKEVLRPILYFPLSIPKSIFLPLFILAFGISPVQTVAFGVFSIMFLMVVTAMSAVEAVSDDHVRVARSYGASFGQTIRLIYLPSMMPVLLEGIRLSFIFGFTGVLVAEMYASRGGFGRSLASWGESFQVDLLLAGVILVSILAIGVNEIIRQIERRFERWRH